MFVIQHVGLWGHDMWTTNVNASWACLLFRGKNSQGVCLTALQHPLLMWATCVVVVSSLLCLSAVLFLSSSAKTTAWMDHAILKGSANLHGETPQRFYKSCIWHKTAGAVEACFHVAFQKYTFWCPRTGWNTAAVPIFLKIPLALL